MYHQNCGDTEGQHIPGMEYRGKRGRGGGEEYGWQIRRAIRRRDAQRTKVAKCVIRLSRKAAIV